MKPITDLMAAAKEVQEQDDAVCNERFGDAIIAAEAFMEPGEMVVSGDGETHWYSCPVCHSPVGPGYNCCPDCQKPLKRPA